MRKNASRVLHTSAVRTFAVILLAGAAAGCSSDVSRFEGYLSKSDTITTASIGQKNNPAPPSAMSANRVNSANSVNTAATQGIVSEPWKQPMPASNGSTNVASSSNNIYDTMTTGTVVKRDSLPSPTYSSNAGQVLPKERPVKQASAAVEMPDPVTTGTTPKTSQKVAMNVPGDVPVPHKAPARNEAVTPKAPEVKAEAKATVATGNVYKVQPGDSLGRIAANHGTTVAELRKANGLTNDNIRIGQALSVPGSGPAKVETVAAAPAVDKVKTASTPKEYKPPVKQVSVEQAEKETEVAVAAPETTGIGKYRWPARGAIIAAYGANVDGERNDGVDISLPEGSPVKAAENGVVIYSGDGLKKLGNTVLVRHADGKVTVYAHLKALNVQRGDKVRRGQVIASSGMTGSASRPKLHFEVRKDSAPVNPITFLE